MADVEALARWVREERRRGTEDAVLREHALRAGWSPGQVDEALAVGRAPDDGPGFSGPSRLSIVLAAIVLLVIVASMIAGWLMRTGRL